MVKISLKEIDYIQVRNQKFDDKGDLGPSSNRNEENFHGISESIFIDLFLDPDVGYALKDLCDKLRRGNNLYKENEIE